MISEHITCMECGGTAHLTQPLDPEVPVQPGDVLVYVCSDCTHRLDVVVDEEDLIEDD